MPRFPWCRPTPMFKVLRRLVTLTDKPEGQDRSFPSELSVRTQRSGLAMVKVLRGATCGLQSEWGDLAVS